VDTDAGLLAPVVRDADRRTLAEVAAESRELARLAREGRLTAEQMRGATFTLTNLGMYGVEAFTPIIHLPQCAVLGVGRIAKDVALSLTFDHRVIDGAPAARFLDEVRRAVEQPALWLTSQQGEGA
jgi:pyruvate dehydrogenase E2 component (dihydrolipoamide acetyltransferase)